MDVQCYQMALADYFRGSGRNKVLFGTNYPMHQSHRRDIRKTLSYTALNGK